MCVTSSTRAPVITSSLSCDDRKFLQIKENGFHKNASENWEMPLPFRRQDAAMPNNQSGCTPTERLAKNPETETSDEDRLPEVHGEGDKQGPRLSRTTRGHPSSLVASGTYRISGNTILKSRPRYAWNLTPPPSLKAYP